MCKEFEKFECMSDDLRAWVRVLVERFAWPVRLAIQQADIFGIANKFVYDYRTGSLVEEVEL